MQTKHYAANRHRIGKTTYRWDIRFWDEEKADNVFVASGEEDDLEHAKLAAETELRQHPLGHDLVIDRGTYEVDEINDHEYGTVLDANWVQDERWVCNGWPSDDRVEWEEESW